MRRTIWAGAIGAALMMAAPAGAVTIDFDSLGLHVPVTNQFAEVTFSSSPGFAVIATSSAFPLGNSPPHFICTGIIGVGAGCTEDVNVAFTNPVNNLTFHAINIRAGGIVALIDVFDAGGLLATVNLVTDDVPFVTDLIDLSAYFNVTAIAIREVALPLGYDDFNFDISSTVASPEPASMALFGLGLLGLSAARRCR